MLSHVHVHTCSHPYMYMYTHALTCTCIHTHTGKPPTDDVDSNLLESLDEDSNSVDYTEIPRPKPSLEVTSKTTYTQQQNTKKMLDFESPIAGPGKDRNVGALMEEVGQDVDLKVDIMERKEKMGSKTDLYVSYKICTDVS